MSLSQNLRWLSDILHGSLVLFVKQQQSLHRNQDVSNAAYWRFSAWMSLARINNFKLFQYGQNSAGSVILYLIMEMPLLFIVMTSSKQICLGYKYKQINQRACGTWWAPYSVVLSYFKAITSDGIVSCELDPQCKLHKTLRAQGSQLSLTPILLSYDYNPIIRNVHFMRIMF